MPDDAAVPPASMTIDRGSPVPFYFQLARVLRDEILAGRWKPGQRMISETALCSQFDVSRSTVRQALQSLEAEGLVSRQKGRGTFIADTRSNSWMLQSRAGFYHDEVARMGHLVSSQVLRAAVETLPAWAAEALQLPKGTEGITLERLRSVDGRVALYVVNHLPARLADVVKAQGEHDSLYEMLEQREGLAVHGGRRSVEAVNAGRRLGQLLGVDASAPVAFIESISSDAEGTPFDCYRAWLRTDRLRIEIDVGGSARTDGASQAGTPADRIVADRTA